VTRPYPVVLAIGNAIDPRVVVGTHISCPPGPGGVPAAIANIATTAVDHAASVTLTGNPAPTLIAGLAGCTFEVPPAGICYLRMVGMYCTFYRFVCVRRALTLGFLS
jgi:hypothetical protein